MFALASGSGVAAAAVGTGARVGGAAGASGSVTAPTVASAAGGVPATALVIVVVLVVAGALTGVAGFGFALVATAALATALEPATAVTFVILPLLAVNLSLARDLSTGQLRACGRRFGPLIAATLGGTVVGMAVVGRLPAGPLRVGLGVLTLAYVAAAQRVVPLPDAGTGLDESLPTTVAVGAVSGLLFGGTNVGVQLIAYLRSRDLSHDLFVGVVATVFLGVNAVRVVVAALLGLYPGATVALASVAAAVPALAGVAVGRRLRDRVSPAWRRRLVLGLLVVVGARLVTSGL